MARTLTQAKNQKRSRRVQRNRAERRKRAASFVWAQPDIRIVDEMHVMKAMGWLPQMGEDVVYCSATKGGGDEPNLPFAGVRCHVLGQQADPSLYRVKPILEDGTLLTGPDSWKDVHIRWLFPCL